MKRLPCCLAIAAVITASGGGRLQAQPPAPGGTPRPAFSPYLNLVRPGGSPTLNYYGLVRPEQQFRQSIQNLQTTVAGNQQALGNLQNDVNGVPGTGHPTQFLNYGGYFLNSGSFGGTANRPGGGTMQFRAGVGQAPPRR